MEDKPKSKIIPIICALIALLLIFLIGYIVITEYVNPKTDDENVITYLEN